MIKYAGIGSRETPAEILNYFERLGTYFAKQGFILRSGHAEGADLAFENGCDKARGNKEIYLPWKGFNNSGSALIVKSEDAFKIGEQFHPNWSRLSDGAKKLQARNSHQILGENLDDPVNFVICWTKGGKKQGGTAQAIRLAEFHKVSVFNAGSYNSIEEIKKELRDFFTNLQII